MEKEIKKVADIAHPSLDILKEYFENLTYDWATTAIPPVSNFALYKKENTENHQKENTINLNRTLFSHIFPQKIIDNINKDKFISNIEDKIMLCAPTGRAAQRMKEATGFSARTIHSLLGWEPHTNKFTRGIEDPLPQELIIIDEFSMVDIFLANSLLKAIRPDTIIVIVGDEAQLESVNPGNVLGDLMNELSPVGEQVKNTISSLELVLNNVNKTLNDENRQNFKVILENLSATTINLNKTLASVEKMVNQQNGSIAKTADNLNSFIANLNQNNQKISNILTNLDSTTKSINDADLYKTIKTIQTTLIALNTTINQLNNGNGTASKLLNDPAMYTQLQSTIKSVNTLVDDIKVHPKRYISVSVFGKKDKRTPLTKPLSDTLGHE